MTGWVTGLFKDLRMGDMNRSGASLKRVSHHSLSKRTKRWERSKRSCKNSAPKCTQVKKPLGQDFSLI